MRPPLYALAVLLAVLIVPSSAHAYVLGAADGSPEAAPLARQMGAQTYRLVMDPSLPLDYYAPRVEAFRAQGMRPQIVVGGEGTTVRGRKVRDWKIINYAIKAYRRWPDAFSVSVVNEPDGSGASVCGYYKTYSTAYKMLKRAGVKRVLFGEFTPFDSAWLWTAAILNRCAKGHDVLADGFAWHCYDNHPTHTLGISHAKWLRNALRDARPALHTRRGRALPMYCTEFGAPTAEHGVTGVTMSEAQGAALWSMAFHQARRYKLAQIVTWQILPSGDESQWDTSVIRRDGSPTAAYATIASAR
jgi:hypothetical protein